MLGVVHESGNGRLCCKTLFGSLKTNFPGCGRGDRIIVCGPQQLVMNSPATSVARLRAIVAWLLSSRENRCKAILEFATLSATTGHLGRHRMRDRSLYEFSRIAGE